MKQHEKPKALVETGNKTLFQRAVEKLADCEIDEIVVNTHHFSEQVKKYIAENDFGIPIKISDESEKLLDTGGGLKKAEPLLAGSSPILIYNVDILSSLDLKSVITAHHKSGALATVVVRNRDTQRYLKFNTEKRLVGWVNKKTGETKIALPEYFENSTEMAFSGIHVVSAEIFKFMPNKEKFSIIDFYLNLAKDHLIKGYFDDSDFWMDVGKPEQLEKARQMFSE